MGCAAATSRSDWALGSGHAGLRVGGWEFERVDVVAGRIEVMGEVVGATVVMGDEAVLGRVVLEGVGNGG